MRYAAGPSSRTSPTAARALARAGLGLAPLLALGLVLAPRVARACSCMAPPPPAKAIEASDAVFEARPFSMSNDAQKARYNFEVDRVWKGDIPSRVEITTPLHSATCGRSYQIGTQYVIYAQRSKDGTWADYLCTRTRTSQSAAEDLQALGAGHPPLDGSPLPAGESGGDSTEPPRIEAGPVEPPPTEPSRRGCAVEKPHNPTAFGGLVLLGLAVAIGRRRAVRSPGPR